MSLFPVATRTLAEKVGTQLSFTDLYNNLQKEKSSRQYDDSTTLIDENGITHILPWAYNKEFEKFDLPPSLKKLKIDDFNQVTFSSWGS